MENLAITALDIGALANGISDPLSMTSDQLAMVTQFLKDHRSQFRTFYNGDAEVEGAVQVGRGRDLLGVPGRREADAQEGRDERRSSPSAKEGQMLWTCGYGISPDIDPANLDAAYALLNWYTSLPPQIYAATNFNYLTSNEGILDAVPPDRRRGSRPRFAVQPRTTRSRRARPMIGTPGSPPGQR